MKIKHIEIHHLQIPMNVKFAQSNNITQTSSSMLVKLYTYDGKVGLGESCPRTYVTGETPKSVRYDIKEVTSLICSMTFDTIEEIKKLVTEELPEMIGLSSICALELALLDGWCKTRKVTIWDALDLTPKSTYDYTGVIPFSNITALKPLLSKFAFKEIKIKVGNDLDKNLSQINAIKEVYGNDCPIRVDANSGWTLPEAMEQTTRLIEQNVQCIEQPFPTSMDKAMRCLTYNFGSWVAIMVDESLTDYKSGKRLIEQKACTRFNLKLSKNGGIFNSLKIYELAKMHGVRCQLGAHFGETSILTAAGLIFATIATELEALEGGMGTILLSKDVTDNPIMIGPEANIYIDQIKNKLGLGVGDDFNVNSLSENNSPSIIKPVSRESYFRFTLSKAAFRIR